MLKILLTDKKSNHQLKIIKPIPISWLKSAGMLKSKKQELVEHIKSIKQEWDN